MLKAAITLLAVMGRELIPIGLESISYDVLVQGGIAQVTLRQKYINNMENAVNTVFHFPSSDKAVFSSLEAKFRGSTVRGLIKEKNQAKQQFEEEKAKGNTVVYVDSDSANPDVMTAKLGNFPAKESLEIALTFIMPLDIINNMYWELIIPSTLTPRYDPGTSARNSANYDYNLKEYTYTVAQEYPWDISVNIRWPTEIGMVYTTSHSESTSIDYSGGKNAHAYFNRREIPNKDFHLIIEDKQLYKDQVSVAKSDLPFLSNQLPKYAALIQFIPPLYKTLIEMNNGKLPSREMVQAFARQYAKNEFIFIVDRSGSMDGRRISLVREAMQKIIGELPKESYFNVISFGSSFDYMFSSSVPLSDGYTGTAKNKFDTFEADYGGTEILQPINSVIYTVKPEGMLRTVIILTDGDVSNTYETIQACKKLKLMQGTKILTVGIGSGASTQLVRGMAEAGDGKAIFIEDNVDQETFAIKIQDLVNEAITPFLFNFSYDFDPKYVEAIAPYLGPNNLVSPNEPFMSYVLLKNSMVGALGKSTTVKISFNDPISRTRVTKEFVISLNDEISSHSIYHKMAVYHILRSDELDLKGYYLNPVLQSEPSILTKLSINYQVLSSKYTAFICVVAEKLVNPQTTKDYAIQSVESSDYQNTPQSSPSSTRSRASMVLGGFSLIIFLLLLLEVFLV
jgi:uncharacterized protein YegL